MMQLTGIKTHRLRTEAVHERRNDLLGSAVKFVLWQAIILLASERAEGDDINDSCVNVGMAHPVIGIMVIDAIR
jgi:hypothetical protein